MIPDDRQFEANPEALAREIYEAINTDDEPYEDVGARLLDDYNNATTQERTIINNTFITLTGWSLETLLENAEVNSKND